MKQAYVIAFNESLLQGESFETALANLKRVLASKGHTRLLPQILRASTRELEAKLKQRTVVVTVATDAGVESEKITATLAALNLATTDCEQKVDSTLIGGFTVRGRGHYFDASYKNALLRLYRAVTTS